MSKNIITVLKTESINFYSGIPSKTGFWSLPKASFWSTGSAPSNPVTSLVADYGDDEDESEDGGWALNFFLISIKPHKKH